MWNFMPRGVNATVQSALDIKLFEGQNWVEALVRESIQNSQDAKITESSEPVRCSFTLKKIPKAVFLQYCGDNEVLVENHVAARDGDPKALRIPVISKNLPPEIPILIVEDFGTVGLDGPYDDLDKKQQSVGNFNGFWWQSGSSKKDAKKGGSHGVGKAALCLASDLRAFWAYTKRNTDGRSLLLGYCSFPAFKRTVKGNNEYYAGYARFGTVSEQDEDGFLLPYTEEQQVTGGFINAFGIQRNVESGLSVVIPLPVAELREPKLIIRSVIENYAYPILSGDLVVDVETQGRPPVRLEQTSLKEMTRKFFPEKEKDITFLDEIVALKKSTFKPLEINLEDGITEASFTDEQLNSLRSSYLSGEMTAVRVYVLINKEGDTSYKKSFFELFFKETEEEQKGTSYFIRNNLLIRNESGNFKSPLANCLFLATHSSLTEFLREAEGPQHVSWNREYIEGLYKTILLPRIKASATKVFQLISREETEEVINNFAEDIFSIYEPQEEKTPGTVAKPVVEKPKIDAKPPSYALTRIMGGIKILPPQDVSQLEPFTATVRFAYDIERGSPFKKYDERDFDLEGILTQGSNSIFTLDSQGIEVIRAERNVLSFTAMGKDFEVQLTGFDPNRDLIVNISKVSVEE